MSVLDSKKVIKSLQKKGFDIGLNHSPDHKYFDYKVNGRLVFSTKVSHGGKKDIGPALIAMMARQCFLTKKQFINLINCPLSKDRFRKIIIEKKLHI